MFTEEIVSTTTTTLVTLDSYSSTITDYIVGPFHERFKANITIQWNNDTVLYTEICKS